LCDVPKKCRTPDRTETSPTTVVRVVLIAISVFASIALQATSGIAAQDSDFTEGVFGRELPVDAPAQYRQDYLLAPSSISPNQKLALIYPKEGDEFPTDPESRTADNYVVALDPFRILGSLPVAYFENINHKGLSVNWAKDSSAAVIVNQGKWSPRCVIAFEIKDGHIVHQRELSQAVSDFLQADYNKCQPEDFMEIALNGSWKLNDKNQVIAKCVSDSNGKGIPGTKSWRARFEGIWSVAEEKWLHKRITPVFCRNYRDSDLPK
jgi:hypothetical protein